MNRCALEAESTGLRMNQQGGTRERDAQGSDRSAEGDGEGSELASQPASSLGKGLPTGLGLHSGPLSP